jgi:hypothetical protein
MNTNNKSCCICLDNINPIYNLHCSHKVCKECITKLQSSHCPICRKELSHKDDKIPLHILRMILCRELEQKDIALRKDYVISLYLQQHTNVNIQLLYSALCIFEEPEILLTLTPKELKFLISNH